MIPTLTWTLPRPAKSRYKGAFPLYFEENLIQLLGYPERILHPFGGMAQTGIRVDIKPDVQPDVVGDAHALPFDDGAFDLVVLDPPYSDEEAAELYETPPLRRAQYVAEAVRVLRDGGWLALYADREPARPPRCNHTLRIIVVLRPHHRPRTCMVFQKRKPGMPHYGTEPGEAQLEAAISSASSSRSPLVPPMPWLARGARRAARQPCARHLEADAMSAPMAHEPAAPVATSHDLPHAAESAYYASTSLPLRQAADALADAAQALDAAARALLRAVNQAPQLPPGATPLLHGSELSRIAVKVARTRARPGEEIHYRDWFSLVERAGYRVGGRDALATFLTALSRADEVEQIGGRSGLYRLREGPA